MFQEENKKMESLTYQKNLKSSPKKMRMIRDLIVRMNPEDALSFLMYTPTKTGKIYYKVIKSAISNATKSLKIPADMLKFKVLTVEEGRKLKRFKAGSKGMAKPITRKYSHVKVILTQKELKSTGKVIEAEEVNDSVKQTKNDDLATKEKKIEVKSDKKNIVKSLVSKKKVIKNK